MDYRRKGVKFGIEIMVSYILLTSVLLHAPS